MNKLLITTAILGALAVPSLASAAVNGTVTVNGNVAPRCQFTSGTNTITITELAAADGTLAPGTVNGQSANLAGWCNGTNSTMSVQADSLVNSTALQTGFSNQVDFTATASANSVSATDTVSTDHTAGTASKVGIFTGTIGVALSAAATDGGSTLKLVAGPYTGDVIVTLAAAL